MSLVLPWWAWVVLLRSEAWPFHARSGHSELSEGSAFELPATELVRSAQDDANFEGKIPQRHPFPTFPVQAEGKPVNRLKPAVVVVAFAVVAASSGCEKASQSAPEPPTVKVALPEQREVVEFGEFTGRTQASDIVEIRARVQGYLEPIEQPFEEGGPVESGQLLFRIEQAPFRAKVDAANARLAQAQAALKLANANLARAEKLVASGTVTQEEYQTRLAERDAAQADTMAAEAQVKQATIDLGYTELLSPVKGIAGERIVDPGNLVGGAQNTLLTTVRRVDPMHVYFDVSERDVLEILEQYRQSGREFDRSSAPKVFLQLTDEKGYPHEGFIDFLDNQVDSETGTAMVRGVFDNAELFLYPGLFVRLRIPRGKPKPAILIEERAIGTDLGGKYVLTVGHDNMVSRTYVELGQLDRGMRVVTSGLAAEQKYIVAGIQKARPGLPVKVEAASPEQAAAGTGESPSPDAPEGNAAPGNGSASKAAPDAAPSAESARPSEAAR
jgi:multidrug efflux system membrane fusion protein